MFRRRASEAKRKGLRMARDTERDRAGEREKEREGGREEETQGEKAGKL